MCGHFFPPLPWSGGLDGGFNRGAIAGRLVPALLGAILLSGLIALFDSARGWAILVIFGHSSSPEGL